VRAVVIAGQRELAVVRRRVAYDVRNTREPSLELELQLACGGELRVMVELDVRDDGDVGPKRERRAIRLVRLDDEHPATRAGVRPELRHGRADQPRGIAAGLAQ